MQQSSNTVDLSRLVEPSLSESRTNARVHILQALTQGVDEEELQLIVEKYDADRSGGIGGSTGDSNVREVNDNPGYIASLIENKVLKECNFKENSKIF